MHPGYESNAEGCLTTGTLELTQEIIKSQIQTSKDRPKERPGHRNQESHPSASVTQQEPKKPCVHPDSTEALRESLSAPPRSRQRRRGGCRVPEDKLRTRFWRTEVSCAKSHWEVPDDVDWEPGNHLLSSLRTWLQRSKRLAGGRVGRGRPSRGKVEMPVVAAKLRELLS